MFIKYKKKVSVTFQEKKRKIRNKDIKKLFDEK